MRILAIRGENIASLRHFEVDFTVEPLLSAGLYAITGPTGAGKSSLLDALCLALFLKAPRLDGVSNQGPSLDSALGSLGMHQPENLIRRGCHTGYSEVDFAGKGGHYRARWGYRAPRRKGSSPQQEFSFVCLDNQQVLVQGAKSREYTEAVQQHLGWTYEQFTRAVLLAQGRFAEFLKADENARAELLEKLTGTGIYAQISSRIYARHKEEALRLEEYRKQAASLGEQGGISPEELEKELAGLNIQIKEEESGAESWRSLQNILDRCAQSGERKAQLEQDIAQALASGQEAKEAQETAAQKAKAAEQALKELEPQARAAELLDQRCMDQLESLKTAQAGEAQAKKRLGQAQAREEEIQQRLVSLKSLLDQEESWRELSAQALVLVESASMVRHLLGQYGEEHRKQAQAQDRVQKAKVALDATENQTQSLQKAASLAAERAGSQSPEALAAQISEARKAGLAQDQEFQALEFTRDLKAMGLELSRLHAELEAARLQEAGASGRVEAAFQAYNRASLAQSADVKHLRAQLQNGSPCPVCGALEHPYAQSHQGLEDLAKAQHEDLNQAQAQHKEAQQALSQLLARQRSGEEKQAGLSRQLQALPPLAPGHPALDYSPGQWESHVEEGRAAQKAMEARLDEQMRLSLEAQQSQATAEKALQQLQAEQKALQQLEETLSLYNHSLQTARESLDALLPKDWHDLWSKDAQAYVRKLEASIESTQRELEAFAKAREEKLLLESELKPLGLSLEQLRLDLEENSLKLKEQESLQQKLREERQLILGGAPWAPLLKASLQEAERTAALAKKMDAELEQQRQRYKELMAASKAQQDLLAQGVENLSSHPLYNADLQALDFRQALAYATKQFGQLTPRLQELRQRQAEVSLSLGKAKENAQTLARLERQILDQAKTAGHWAALNSLLGSADGKAFRKIAQQYTLEQLLAQANAQLAGITPRYQLLALPGSMNFCIADAESFGEKRPVHTLSGGESFIVSLALALGLAQMAAGQLQVESLFIDEGFGTLDPDTLRSVMGALSSLQSQGRKVGLITHVEEMKHQIPVRIEVRKVAQGASTVHIVG